MGFKEDLLEYKEKIDAELDRFLNSDNLINKNIKEFTLRGGKRIRPILVMQGFDAFADENVNKENEKIKYEIIKAAISVELMQTSFLIHDDIMDKSEVRRNKPTIHKLIGEEKAIIAGNVAMKLAQDALLRISVSNDIKLKALNKFNEIVENTNKGQLLDIELGKKRINEVNEDDIDKVHTLKTAKYTIEGPLQLGAILANAEEDKINALSEFSLALGKAFQIQDDILGVFGDEDKLGKSVKSDIVEGKKTLLMWFAYNHGDDKKFIIDHLGKDVNDDEFERLKEIIVKTGSLKYSKKRFNELMDKARNELDKLNMKEEAKSFLYGLMNYLSNREF